jgi:hypothetical protein
MTEPLLSALFLKGATIALEKIASHLMQSVDATVPILQNIESDLHVLRTAFVDDALDCLREGDIGAYKKAAREAKNRNRLNPYPSFLYVDALYRERNYNAASEALWECVQWYGPNCPLLPTSIRDAVSQSTTLDLYSNATISNTVETGPGSTFQGVAVCRGGIVSAWQHRYGIASLTVGTLLNYKPWSVADDVSSINIFYDDGANERPIYWLTDRILVHPFGSGGSLQAVDLTNPTDRVNITEQQAHRIFGDMSGVISLRHSGKLRGVSVDITERFVSIPGGGGWSIGTHGKVVRATLTPSVRDTSADNASQYGAV